MGAGWVAGGTRARAMVNRCVGIEGAHAMAVTGALGDALRFLEGTAYRRDLDTEGSLADTQRSVGITLLWHLRVLAGWQPRKGTQAIRLLASGFEIANTEEHLRLLAGTETDVPHPPYRLGALATAWPRLVATRSAAELRAALTTSAWGDPGSDSPAAVTTGMRLSAAVRTAVAVPETARWAAGQAALLVAREVFLAGRPMMPSSARRAARLLGARAVGATSFAEFRRNLPARARWSLEEAEDGADLWRAEARWWHEVEQDGAALLRSSRHGSAQVVGSVAVLAADAWRVQAALELAVRGGGSSEALDAVF